MAEIIPYFPGAEAWNMQSSAKQIDQCCGLGKGINLFDNPHFGTGVINQRGIVGESANTAPGNFHYSLDRWWMFSPGTWELTPEGIKLDNVGSYSYWSLAQPTEQFGPKTGLTFRCPVTVSILLNNTCYSLTIGLGILLDASTKSLRMGYGIELCYRFSGTNTTYPTFEFKFYPVLLDSNGGSITIKAAKLELGTEQTLCHREANGDWVLNDPPPNLALELSKCQKYQIQIVNSFWRRGSGFVGIGYGDVVSRAYITLPLPAKCNGNPTIVYSGKWVLWPTDGSLGDNWTGGLPVTGMSPYYTPGNQIAVRVSASQVLSYKTYALIHLSGPITNSLLLDMNI